VNPLTQTAGRNALRTGVILLIFALVATALLVFTFTQTQPTIERSQQAKILALINQVLPASLYDNDLLAGQQSVPPNPLLGTRQPSAMWIARRGGDVTAVVMEAIAPDGYGGNIHLIIGIDASGAITGARVTAHRETPGLGDYIERSKSPWIEQFVGKSLARPLPKHWKVAKDNGQFDARTGATITPRAVVKAVKSALDYFTQQRAAILAPLVVPAAVPAVAPIDKPTAVPAAAPIKETPK
jgi:Na+-translocating ferredoxin:NAD+ oxidoreductase subunit G